MPHRLLDRLNWIDALPAEARLRATPRQFHRGQTIFAPTPDPDSVFILERGLVRLYRLSADGAEFTLGFVRPGEVFGEIAAFANRPRESFAQAVDRCEMIELAQGVFAGVMQTVPGLGFSVAQQIEQRLHRTETLAHDLAFRSVAARLADVLLMLMEDFSDGPDGPPAIRLQLTQAEFATMVGAARPTVNQTFHQFRNAGLAAFEKGQVLILDPEGLRRLAQSESHRSAA